MFAQKKTSCHMCYLTTYNPDQEMKRYGAYIIERHDKQRNYTYPIKSFEQVSEQIPNLDVSSSNQPSH